MSKKLTDEERALKEIEKFKVVTESEVRNITENSDKKLGWFILQTHAGKEAAAKRSIEDGFIASGANSKVGMVLMPEKVFQEVRGDKLKKIKRKMYPGYLFIICERFEEDGELTRKIHQDVYNSVISAHHIHGFSGQEKDQLPRMISILDINTILKQIPKGDEVEKTYKFEQGTPVKIIEGQFENLPAEIEEVVDEEKGRIKLKVTLLGTATFVEVNFSEIEVITES